MTAGASAATPGSEGRRVERLLPVAVCAVVFAVAASTITPWPVGVFEDDGIYTVLARALATGEGYRMINLPGAPHATHYPPGYPAVLALLWRVAPEFPDNVAVFKFANAGFLAAAAGGVYWFARRRLSFRAEASAVIALAGTLSVLLLYFTGILLSEPLFLALLVPALFATERAADDGNLTWVVAAGLLLGVLALVRTLGIVALGAGVFVLLWRGRGRAATILLLVAGCFVVPWQVWVEVYRDEVPGVLMGKYGAYGPWMAEGYREGGLPFARDVVLMNIRRLHDMVSYVSMPVAPPAWRVMVSLGVTAVVGGGLLALSRYAPVAASFVALYFGVVIVWPFEPDRFIVALWPLLVLATAAAARALWRWRPIGVGLWGGRVVALASVACLVAGHAVYNWRGYRNEWWAAVPRQMGESAKPFVEWVARHTAPDDVVATEHDLIVYLYTGRRAVPTAGYRASQRVRPAGPEEVLASVEDVVETLRPRYYVTGWPAVLAAADSLTTRTPPLLHRVGSISNAVIYERLPP